MTTPIIQNVAAELNLPVSPVVSAIAEEIRRRHGMAGVAVLFYGSCLRRPDADLDDALLDFYLLVDDYKAAYDKTWLALANRLLPPNAFYCESDWNGRRLRAKYVVISLADFTRGCGAETENVSIWARFSQPARLVWSRDAATVAAVAEACSAAVRTMLGRSWCLLPDTRDAEAVWVRGFQETYAAELRPESSDRAKHIFETDRDRYVALAQIVMTELGTPRQPRAQAERDWRRRRRLGKLLNFARLVKAAFTFDGGVDYVLWKIRRHSGVVIPVSDWQRRHPLLAAPALAWQLYRRGAFR